MAHTHKNYLTYPLTEEEKSKYGIDPEELDLNDLIDIDALFGKNIRQNKIKRN